jgi:hypothetical protein
MRRNRLSTAFALVCLLSLAQAAFAQGNRGAANPNANRPIPRNPDGTVSFAPPAGERGVWDRQDYRAILPETKEQAALRDREGQRQDNGPEGLKPNYSEVPFQPWAESLYMFRQTHEGEPYIRCKPGGGFRAMATPYGTDIVQVPEEQRIYIFATGGPHTFRPLYMDGRAHPADLDPSYYGHSTGKWEGDTLVIDTVGINERGWLDARGIPNTTKAHLTEKITRLDFTTLRYEITIDDPGAYTKPWTTGMLMTWFPNRESFEFLCQDGNLAPLLAIGEGNTKVDRSSSIVP